LFPTPKAEMNEEQKELCGQCGAEIDPTRRVDFTLKDGTRVCEACFVKETPRVTQSKNDWSN
jgi:NMD protein affecting ribosome stability and mRNA decay